MLHSALEIDNVRELRRRGYSLGQIYEVTSIPKTTIRTWISDISLSEAQLTRLKNRTQKALQAGRLRVQTSAKNKRIGLENSLLIKGKNDIGNLTKRDLFIAGIALYWAEGFKNKHEHRLGFCNSDPKMIKFYIWWLEKILAVNKNDIIARLTLNISYKKKVREMEKYWSELTGLPLSQFTKTFYQTSKWKKQYNVDNYHGVLRVHVKDSINNLLKMKGWIEGLNSAKMAK
ncbi:MAG: hypothetical protein HY429_01950 [Candidatus Levybacteria bacterium]|nr:hypothetical protein [Candidatus Levybacteria bacterium]